MPNQHSAPDSQSPDEYETVDLGEVAATLAREGYAARLISTGGNVVTVAVGDEDPSTGTARIQIGPGITYPAGGGETRTVGLIPELAVGLGSDPEGARDVQIPTGSPAPVEAVLAAVRTLWDATA